MSLELIGGNNASAVELGIQLVHLTSGEDIIGRVFLDGAVYRIERPVVPVHIPNPSDQGRMHISLMPFRPYVEKDLTIPESSVMFTVDIVESMQKFYIQFTSNIQVAQSLPKNLQ